MTGGSRGTRGTRGSCVPFLTLEIVLVGGERGRGSEVEYDVEWGERG